MTPISNRHAGKRVRIKGIVPMTDGEYMIGQGDHVGVLEGVEGDRFRFMKEGWSGPAKLSVRMWRIAEILPEVVS